MDKARRRNAVAREARRLLGEYRRAGGDGARIGAADAKRAYILPLFRSLGWDAEGEATAEARASRGRVDYGFRAGGLPVFCLKAAGMGAGGMERPEWMAEAANYSWLKAAPWVVLTDFRVLRVLDAGAGASDPASAQLFEICCADMAGGGALDRLLLLSRESVAEGRLAAASERRGAVGTAAPVDRRLREDLLKARGALAASIACSNPGLDEGVREESVERMLSRLVFMRALEDRGLSDPVLGPPAGDVADTGAAGGGGAGRGGGARLLDGLRRKFRRLDRAYGTGLFAPHPCDRLEMDDRALAGAVGMLYEPAGRMHRYDYSVLDVDVLGAVYEQYLGAVSAGRLPGGGAGAGRRRARGIYYTPAGIVGFMADVLVRRLVEDGQDPDTMRVCDPSCGSGAFLVRCAREIAAARHGKSARAVRAARAGAPRSAALGRATVRTIEENVFGIDLDRAAVEKARLNLLLCGVGRGVRPPDVRGAVRHGNSLIGAGAPRSVEPNPFPWDLGFSDKFDGMIGNPPYIRNRGMSPGAKSWYAGNYASASGQYDAYVLFVERALARVRNGGYVAFITSNKYAAAAYGAALRRHILGTARIRMIVDVSDARVFPEPDVYPWIIVLQKEPSAQGRRSNTMLVGRAGAGGGSPSPYACKLSRVPQAAFEDSPGNVFYVDAPGPGGGSGVGAGVAAAAGEAPGGRGGAADYRISRMVMDSLDRDDGTTILLGSFTMRETVHTGNVRDKLLLREGGGPAHKRIIRGRDMGRYCHEWGGYWLDTGYKPTGKEYMRINEPALFGGKKIFLRDIARRITACYDDSGLYSVNTLFVIRTDEPVGGIRYDPLYLLAVLNSSLMSWYLAKRFGAAHVASGYLRCKKQFVEKLPVMAVPPGRQAPIAGAVRKLHRLVKKRAAMAGGEGSDGWREADDAVRRQDEAIDGMIFRLYGITDKAGEIIRRAVPEATVRVGAAARRHAGA